MSCNLPGECQPQVSPKFAEQFGDGAELPEGHLPASRRGQHEIPVVSGGSMGLWTPGPLLSAGGGSVTSRV